MSTRCNVIIKDQDQSLMFYRHSDGYPEGVAPSLGQFMKLLRTGKIRNDVEQAAGWLILIGASEYDTHHDFKNSETYGEPAHSTLEALIDNPPDWKVGAYEPSIGIHGDIEFLYEIDLDAKTLTGWHHDGRQKGEWTLVEELTEEEPLSAA